MRLATPLGLACSTLLIAAAALAAGPRADAGPLPPLQLLGAEPFRPGRWEVRWVDARGTGHGAEQRRICIADPEALAMTGFADAPPGNCSYQPIEDQPTRARLSYSCPGAGFGHVEIRRLSLNQFSVDAQGVRGREPFSVRAEYQRVGRCEGMQ